MRHTLRPFLVVAPALGALILAAVPPAPSAADPRAACPPGEGFRPLTNLHPVRMVVLGAAPDDSLFKQRRHQEYVLELAELLTRVAPEVTLVVDGLTAGELPAKLRPLERGHRPRFSDGPGRFFQQDPFKPGVTGAYAESAIFGQPPPRLLELTGARLVDDPSWRGAGGDIMAFPGGVVVHGSRTPHEFLNHGSGGRAIRVRTDWLGVGHVDELFGLVPTAGGGRCDFAIVHASPALALETLERARQRDPGESAGPWPWRMSDPFQKDRTVHPGPRSCLDALPALGSPFGESTLQTTVAQVLDCPDLIRANRRYERIVRRDLDRVVDAVRRETGCPRVSTLALPALFRPIEDFIVYGTAHDAAHSLNPNPVNALVIGRDVIMAWQPNREVEAVVRERLGAIGLTAHFIDTPALLNGFVHCTANTVRHCDPAARADDRADRPDGPSDPGSVT